MARDTALMAQAAARLPPVCALTLVPTPDWPVNHFRFVDGDAEGGNVVPALQNGDSVVTVAQNGVAGVGGGGEPQAAVVAPQAGTGAGAAEGAAEPGAGAVAVGAPAVEGNDGGGDLAMDAHPPAAATGGAAGEAVAPVAAAAALAAAGGAVVPVAAGEAVAPGQAVAAAPVNVDVKMDLVHTAAASEAGMAAVLNSMPIQVLQAAKHQSFHLKAQATQCLLVRLARKLVRALPWQATKGLQQLPHPATKEQRQ